MAVYQEALEQLGARAEETLQAEKGHLNEFYKLLFEICDEGTVDPNRKLNYREHIDPKLKAINPRHWDDNNTVEWLATQFHAHAQVSMQRIEPYERYGDLMKGYDFVFESANGDFLARIQIITPDELEEGEKVRYSMEVVKACRFEIEGVGRNADEYDDPTKASELVLVQIACAAALALIEPPASE